MAQLHYETAHVVHGVKIEYDRQFPVLEKIRVGFKEEAKTDEEREKSFASTAQFLYGSFIPRG